MYATLQRIDAIAPHIRTFWFKPEGPFTYVAGQFTELYLPHEADNRGEKRWFTISSSPTEPLFSITTKFANGRSSTYKQVLAAQQPGARLHFAEPLGDFVLPKDKHIPLVFVAGGIGITPVRSMVTYLKDSGEQRSVTILYTARHQNELAFIDELRHYTPHVTTTLSGETTWSHAGRLSIQHLLDATRGKTSPLIYLSGPESMVEIMHSELRKNGISQNRLVVDFFHGYQA